MKLSSPAITEYADFSGNVRYFERGGAALMREWHRFSSLRNPPNFC